MDARGLGAFCAKPKDKSAHNESRDFYTHMALMDARRFAGGFCRILDVIIKKL